MEGKKKRIEQVFIHAMANNGFSVGRTKEGMVVFVERGIPGEEVMVELFSKKKGSWYGKIVDRIISSPHHVAPYCSHFGACGGCSWQNISYNEQVNQKEIWVRDAIHRIAKIQNVPFEPILAAVDTKYYRNKLEFSFSTHRWWTDEQERDTSHSSALGFHRPGHFSKVVNIDHCFHQPGISNELRNFIRNFAMDRGWEFYDIKEHKGYLRNLTIRNNLAGEFMLIVAVAYRSDDRMSLLVQELVKRFPEIKSLYSVVNPKLNDSIYDLELTLEHGEYCLTEHLDHAKFIIGPKSFFQTNPKQACKLFHTVEEYCSLSGEETVLDLYCGVGSIGIYLARHAAQVWGVETIPAAVEDAQKNANANQLTNCKFYVAEAENLPLAQWLKDKGTPDIVVVDPPRMGLHEKVCMELLQLRCPKIIYVSCNPSTQARDLERLSSAYDLTKIRPVDMFPQTNHVECVALLSLRP